jgi:hypothetical protein
MQEISKAQLALPRELWIEICNYLSDFDLVVISAVCKLFNTIEKEIEKNRPSILSKKITCYRHYLDYYKQELALEQVFIKNGSSTSSYRYSNDLQKKKEWLEKELPQLEKKLEDYQIKQTLQLFYKLFGGEKEFYKIPIIQDQGQYQFLFQHITYQDLAVPLMRGSITEDLFVCFKINETAQETLYFIKYHASTICLISPHKKPRKMSLIEKGTFTNKAKYDKARFLLSAFKQI